MQCEEARGVLSEYLNGELDDQLCAEIEQHLAECGNCRIMVDTLRKTVVLYRDYGHEEVPQDIKARLYTVLRLDPGQRDIV